MRVLPAVFGLSLVAGAFLLSQGCGGSTTDDGLKTQPNVVAGNAGAAGSTAGKAGASGSGTAGAGNTAGTGTAGKGTAGKAGSGTAGTSQGDADLFDVMVPDAMLGDGTVADCYDCMKAQCGSELTACQNSNVCGPPVMCILDTCPTAFGNTQELLSCGLGCGIDIQNPEFQQLGLGLAQCVQGKCMDKCQVPMGTGGSGQGGSGTAGSGTAGTGTGTGGFNQQQCQMNAQKCGGACQAEGIACFQAQGCSACFQSQGQSPGCDTNPAWQNVVKCACAHPSECTGCCPN